MPFPKALKTGMPTGQPYSTLLMSSPIRLRSSGESALSHSRTGSPPASVRKKIAGRRLPSFSTESAFRCAGGSAFPSPEYCTIGGTFCKSTSKSKSPPCPYIRRRNKGGASISSQHPQSLHKPLIQHRVGDLHKTGDVGAVDQVPWRAVFLGSLVAVAVDGDHDLVQLVIHFLASPGNARAVLRHFKA